MNDWKSIWNDFCDDVEKSVKKNDVERYFEKNIAKELLSACGWGKYSGLMEQYEIGFATTSGKADFAIVLNKDSNPDVIIELKRPKNKKKDKYTKQLHDYMKQGECDFGILMLGTQMEVYYREHSCIKLVDTIIYEHDNESAHLLIDLLARDYFSVDKVKEYCHDRTVVNKKLDYWSSSEGIERMKEMMAVADNDLTENQKTIFKHSLSLAINRQTAKIIEAVPAVEPGENISNVENSQDNDTKLTSKTPLAENQQGYRLSCQKTLSKYLLSFNSTRTKKIVESIGVKQPLSQITDVELLKKIKGAIKDYEKQNGIHNEYSCAIGKYIEYIENGMTYHDFEHDALLVKNATTSTTKPRQKPKAEKQRKKSAPPFKFSMIDMAAGTTITFAPTGVQVKVVSDDAIEYQGEKYSLSGFCKRYMPEERRIPAGQYQGPAYFTYQGKTLKKLRKEKETK